MPVPATPMRCTLPDLLPVHHRAPRPPSRSPHRPRHRVVKGLPERQDLRRAPPPGRDVVREQHAHERLVPVNPEGAPRVAQVANRAKRSAPEPRPDRGPGGARRVPGQRPLAPGRRVRAARTRGASLASRMRPRPSSARSHSCPSRATFPRWRRARRGRPRPPWPRRCRRSPSPGSARAGARTARWARTSAPRRAPARPRAAPAPRRTCRGSPSGAATRSAKSRSSGAPPRRLQEEPQRQEARVSVEGPRPRRRLERLLPEPLGHDLPPPREGRGEIGGTLRRRKERLARHRIGHGPLEPGPPPGKPARVGEQLAHRHPLLAPAAEARQPFRGRRRRARSAPPSPGVPPGSR